VLVLLPRAHGSEAAAAARPIFETFANLTNEKPENNASKSEGAPANSATRKSQSAIRVHLVHDNVTEELSLEDYVFGVMRAEGTLETEPEALKALAIAIRTFAVRNRDRHAKDGYDFCSTTHCQRFVVGSARVNQGSDGDQALLTVGLLTRTCSPRFGLPKDKSCSTITTKSSNLTLARHAVERQPTSATSGV
jgi:hypothetical protein